MSQPEYRYGLPVLVTFRKHAWLSPVSGMSLTISRIIDNKQGRAYGSMRSWLYGTTFTTGHVSQRSVSHALVKNNGKKCPECSGSSFAPHPDMQMSEGSMELVDNPEMVEGAD